MLRKFYNTVHFEFVTRLVLNLVLNLVSADTDKNSNGKLHYIYKFRLPFESTQEEGPLKRSGLGDAVGGERIFGRRRAHGRVTLRLW